MVAHHRQLCFPGRAFFALSVAVLANHFIPGFTLALGFLLGGIVSPPDAVSAGAITKFVKIPEIHRQPFWKAKVCSTMHHHSLFSSLHW